MRYVILLLAMVGMVVSALALRVHYSTGTEPCSINERWDCGIVNHSPYAEIHGAPVAGIGLLGYMLLAGLGLMRQRWYLLAATMVGCGFALHLTLVEKNVLGVYCLYCVISQVTIALMVLLTAGWLVAGLAGRNQASIC